MNTTTAPEIFTIDDIFAGDVEGQPGAWTVRTVQVIVMPTTPDTDLFGEDIWGAWNIFLIQGDKTLFIGNVQDVRLDPWHRAFLGQYMDHEQDDLFSAVNLPRRDNAIRATVRHYFSNVTLQERRAAYAERVRRLSMVPVVCQINDCGDRRGVANVIVDGRVWGACGYCRDEYGMEVATQA